MAQLKISDLSFGDWVEFHRTKGIYIAPPLFEKANARVIGTHRGAEATEARVTIIIKTKYNIGDEV